VRAGQGKVQKHGGVPKWLRERSAKPPFTGSNPVAALEPIRITQIWYIEFMAQSKKRRKRAPVNKITTGFRVSDKLWAVLQPLIPKHVNPHRFGGGKPRTPDRRCADAVFYVLRTGCQWAALDATALCPHSTAHDRFQHWVEAGVFLQLWQAGVEQFDELKGVDWQWLGPVDK